MASQHDTNTPSGPAVAAVGALRRWRLAARTLAATAALGLVALVAIWVAVEATAGSTEPGAARWALGASLIASCGALALRAALGRRDRLAWTLLLGGAMTTTVGNVVWGSGVAPVAAVPAGVHVAALAFVAAGLLVWRRPHRLVTTDSGDALIWGVAIATLGGLLLAGQMLAAGASVEAPVVLRAIGSIVVLAVAALVVAPGIWNGASRRVTVLAGALIISFTELVATTRSIAGTEEGALTAIGWAAGIACIATAAWQRERQIGVTWSRDVHAMAAPAAIGIVASWVLVGLVAGRSPMLALIAPIAALGVAALRMGLLLRDELRGDAPRSLPTAAAIDSLTGLPGHRAFQETLTREFAAAGEAGRPLALTLIDIDDFTDLNETFGHPEGDRVLAGIGVRLARLVRSTDVLARVGPDQFAWLLRGSDGFNAWRAAERVRADIAESGCAGHAITVSVGVSDLTVATSTAELYRNAEAALEWGRANGANMTVAYSPEVVGPAAPSRGTRQRRDQTLNAVRVLARAVDAKLPGTRRHSERVARVSGLLAEELGWQARRIADLREAALVHNVGKVGVPDAVLQKPGRLDDDEFALVMAHAALGADIVAGVLVPHQVAWVRGHHERFDGSGYPDGLAGDAIPEGARVIAVADAWDAMTAPRPHRPALSAREVLAEFRRGAGTHWDPEVVSALVRLWDRGVLTIESGDVPEVAGEHQERLVGGVLLD